MCPDTSQQSELTVCGFAALEIKYFHGNIQTEEGSLNKILHGKS
jgi:hypothetical protein